MTVARCAYCREPLGASRLHVNDATGGPTGQFCNGAAKNCYLDALDRHMAAQEATDGAQGRQFSSLGAGNVLDPASGGPARNARPARS